MLSVVMLSSDPLALGVSSFRSFRGFFTNFIACFFIPLSQPHILPIILSWLYCPNCACGEKNINPTSLFFGPPPPSPFAGSFVCPGPDVVRTSLSHVSTTKISYIYGFFFEGGLVSGVCILMLLINLVQVKDSGLFSTLTDSSDFLPIPFCIHSKYTPTFSYFLIVRRLCSAVCKKNAQWLRNCILSCC